MKAVVLTAPGGPEKLVLQDIAIPVIKEDEVLVKVKAISINPVEAFIRSNETFLRLVLQLDKKDGKPYILGWDISGVVEQTGKGVTRFKKGDEVFGMVNFIGHGKAYAEYVAAPESHLALKPRNISHEEAAAATLAALTAWQALVDHARIKAGEKVLIHSAAGGVGHYAVQIAKHFGAYVIGTSNASKKDFILSLGADEHINYSTQHFDELIKDADIAIDSIRDVGHVERSLKAVKWGGRVISLSAFPDERICRDALMSRKFLYRMEVASDQEDMEAIASLLEKGQIRSHVSETFRFDELPEAHRHIETGHTQGKIVVKVD